MGQLWTPGGTRATGAIPTSTPVTHPTQCERTRHLFDAGWWWLFDEAAGSFHPGGVNVSMADGSVRFIKDTISCWPNDVANFGPDIQWSADGGYVVGVGTAKPQVWQALSSRRGGEVIALILIEDRVRRLVAQHGAAPGCPDSRTNRPAPF